MAKWFCGNGFALAVNAAPFSFSAPTAIAASAIAALPAAIGVTQPLFDDPARQALYQATKGILRKVDKLALTALRLAASRKESTVGESTLLDATTEALL